MAKKTLPSSQRLRELFDYCPETGVLTWRRSCRGTLQGAVAGTISQRGYRRVRVGGSDFMAHRIIWCWMTGLPPSDQIDHVNRVRSDNRWSNLREADAWLNSTNREVVQMSPGGKGVMLRDGRWRARIWVGGRFRNLGTFDTAEAARVQFKIAEKSLRLDGLRQ